MDKIIVKICKKHGIGEFILEGRGYYRCKKCRSFHVSESRRRKKEKLIILFGGKCIKCGYDKSYRALSFHHRNKEDKCFGLSDKGLCHSWKELVKEAKKCDLLCANCHMEVEEKLDSRVAQRW